MKVADEVTGMKEETSSSQKQEVHSHLIYFDFSISSVNFLQIICRYLSLSYCTPF